MSSALGTPRPASALSHFFRLSWMGRVALWPIGMFAGGAARKPGKRPKTMLALERLEGRETPDDVMGLLRMGFVMGGVPLMSGQLLTPAVALLRGWEAFSPPAPPVVASGRSVAPPEPIHAGGGMDHTASLPPLAAPVVPAASTERVPASVPTTAPVARGSSDADDPLAADWVRAVGDFLDSQTPRASHANAATDLPNPSGGGGSGPAGDGSTPVFGHGLGSGGLAPAGTGLDEVTLTRMAGAQGPSATVPTTLTPVPQAAAPVFAPPVAGQPGQTATPAAGSAANPSQPFLATAYGRTPLAFEPNVGQTDPAVRFLSRGAGVGLWLTDSAAVFSVARPDASPGHQATRDVFRLNFVGANASPTILPQDQLPSTSNYFEGADPAGWHADVANYAGVTFQDLYPGIDLVYHSHTVGDRQLEYGRHPGADPSAVRLAWQGLQGTSQDGRGNLLLHTAGGDVVEQAPVLYQTAADGSRQAVTGSQVVGPNGSVGFRPGSYDPTRPLVIDPVLSFSTYLGGSGIDKAYGIATDQAGNAYVTGSTTSSNFPTTTGTYQPGYSGFGGDAFITKLNAAGTAVVYST